MTHQRMPFQTLDVYVGARELARQVHAAKIRDAELRDQATRAAKSTFLHLCEGLPSEGVAMRRKYFQGAMGSLYETMGAVDLAAAIDAVEQADCDALQALGARLHGMLRGLMR